MTYPYILRRTGFTWFPHSNPIGSKVDVVDLYVANLLIMHTRIRQEAHDGLLTDILGTLQDARYVGL